MTQIKDSIKSLLSLFSHFIWRAQQGKSEIHQPIPSKPAATLSSTLRPTRDLKKIVAPQDFHDLAPIGYAYDPVPEPPSNIDTSPLVFPRCASKACDYISRNTIQVNPREAGLPYRSRFTLVRGNRHWKANLDETIKVLKMIAADDTFTDVERSDGFTLAEIARKQLLPGLEHRMVVATTYMFPSADEARVRIIATLMIMYFVFDDKIEETPEGAPLVKLREEFFSYFKLPTGVKSESSTDLQRHLESTMKAIAKEDDGLDKCGREMVDALHGAFRCVHPPEEGFKSLEEYLIFRRLNVGARVNVHDVRFARYLTLIGDHLGIVNDMASYDKESKALQEGETQDMINIVAVLQTLQSLPDSIAAKKAAYTYQLQVEAWIIQELEALATFGQLTDEEWWFLEAVFLSVTGNIFFCMTSSRYGGKAAAI